MGWGIAGIVLLLSLMPLIGWAERTQKQGNRDSLMILVGIVIATGAACIIACSAVQAD